MIKEEKLIYQDNKSAYNFALCFLLLNTIAMISTLNSMIVNIRIGSFILGNIVLSLLGFLLAMKVKKYHLNWAYASIIVSLIQFVRSFFMPEVEDNKKRLMTLVLMIVSACFLLISSIITVKKAKTRLKYINPNII